MLLIIKNNLYKKKKSNIPIINDFNYNMKMD